MPEARWSASEGSTTPRHGNGWDFSSGPVTYLADEPFMTADEYQSYRDTWLVRYGRHENCSPLCPYQKYQPPLEQPKTFRH